jgi:hypothetical protein
VANPYEARVGGRRNMVGRNTKISSQAGEV